LKANNEECDDKKGFADDGVRFEVVNTLIPSE
jgi:hypothetical protein